MGLEIRLCQPDDYAPLMDIALMHLSPDKRRAYFSNSARVEQASQLLSGAAGVCLVAASAADGVIGYVAGGMQDNPMSDSRYAELERIVVSEQYRGRGVGTELARGFLAWAKAAGADRVLVTTGPRNDAAIRFYEHLGFVVRSVELEKWDL